MNFTIFKYPKTFSLSLRHLDLTSAIISTELLINFLSSCNLLRKLSLESMPLNYKIIE
jgi:hypothetical protein